MVPRRFALIANPRAARGRAPSVMRDALDLLAARGVVADGVISNSIADARERAEWAAGDGRIPVAVGGDGMVRAIAAGASRHGGTIGIIPAGRGNDFARGCGISQETPGAVDTLVDADAKPIDLIGVRAHGSPEPEQIVAGNCYVGFDSLSNAGANSMALGLGMLSYSIAAFRVALTMPVLEISLRLDDQRLEYRGSGVTIANGSFYGGAIEVAPQAKIDDGLLEVVTFHATTRLARSGALLALRGGQHAGRDDVQTHRARTVDVTITPTLQAYADGDPVSHTPLTARVLKDAIKLIR